MKELISKLNKIQVELNAPKNQRNNFGGYNYRSCEDIMQAVKPLLLETGLVITVSDSIEQVGERYYVKAVATITDGEHSISNSALAREPLEKKGMDSSQITGATSSYARKYALNGLLCIDDVKDAEATNTHGKNEKTPAEKARDTRERTRAEKEKVIEDARKWYDYCNNTSLIALDDMNRVHIETTLSLLNDYKLFDINKKLKDLYLSKAQKDEIPDFGG